MNAGASLGDIQTYSIVAATWTDLTEAAVGTAPYRRSFISIASANDRIYVFAGHSTVGGLGQDLSSSDQLFALD